MNRRPIALVLFASIAFLHGCAQGDAIDASGAVYDGISSDASITLTGTEPFWNIAIKPAPDGEHAARFTSPENPDGSEFAVARFAGNNGVGFSGTLDEKAVQIAITPGDCSDGMSDRTYPFAATVALGDATLIGCAYTSAEPFTGPEAP